MRTVLRTLAGAAAVATLSWPLVAPAAAAPAVEQSMVATVEETTSGEFTRSCGSDPGPCTVRGGVSMYFNISVSNWDGQQITFDYVAEGITATSGTDFTRTSGQTKTNYLGNAFVSIPVVDDGVAEPDETLRLRLTGTNRPVDISDTGIGTIVDNGDQFPAGCSATRIDSPSAKLTCGGMPSGRQWRFHVMCTGFPFMDAAGNVVTGNGTSTATCPGSRVILGGQIWFVDVS